MEHLVFPKYQLATSIKLQPNFMNLEEKILNKYLKLLQPERKYLNVDKSKGIAPHKPILLLAVVENISSNIIKSNKIYITPELVESFREIWAKLVLSTHDIRFPLPFYHLKSSIFWKLIANPGFEEMLKLSSQMRSFKNLEAAIDYAELNEDFFRLLKKEDSKNIIISFILKTYFPKSKQNYEFSKSNVKDYISTIENDFLRENAEKYVSSLDLKNQEEVFIRSSIFKKLVPKIYHYKCCISEMTLTTTFNISMLDACHIVPFSTTHNDHVTNGIALCPNLHRAFDRGLITITDNYKVILSKKFKENLESNYRLNQFEGKQIILPRKVIHYPKIENLKWHRLNVFKG